MWRGNMMGLCSGGVDYDFMSNRFFAMLIEAVVVGVRPLLGGGSIPASEVEDQALSFLRERFARKEMGDD
jgi:hypothetical protein